MPLCCGDEYLVHEDPERIGRQPEDKPSVLHYFLWALKLAQIEGLALRTLVRSAVAKSLPSAQQCLYSTPVQRPKLITISGARNGSLAPSPISILCSTTGSIPSPCIVRRLESCTYQSVAAELRLAQYAGIPHAPTTSSSANQPIYTCNTTQRRSWSTVRSSLRPPTRKYRSRPSSYARTLPAV